MPVEDRRALAHRRLGEQDKARIAFPWPLAAAVWPLAALPPPALTDPLLRRMPEKG